jgi:hypothetical protein
MLVTRCFCWTFELNTTPLSHLAAAGKQAEEASRRALVGQRRQAGDLALACAGDLHGLDGRDWLDGRLNLLGGWVAHGTLL